jgi:hypothetical protein
MLLLLKGDNHVQEGSIRFNIIQLIENVVFGRGKRGGIYLTVRSFSNLYSSRW